MIEYINESSKKFLSLINFASPNIISQKENLQIEEIAKLVNSSQNYFMDKNKIGLNMRYSPVNTKENQTIITSILNTLTENSLLYTPKFSRIEQGIRKNQAGNLEILLENKVSDERRIGLGEGKGIGQSTSRSFIEKMGGTFETYEGFSKIIANFNKNKYELVELFGYPNTKDRINEEDNIYGVKINIPLKQ
jgi:hypothetical protein